jgi:hypothetical protein
MEKLLALKTCRLNTVSNFIDHRRIDPSDSVGIIIYNGHFLPHVRGEHTRNTKHLDQQLCAIPLLQYVTPKAVDCVAGFLNVSFFLFSSNSGNRGIW